MSARRKEQQWGTGTAKPEIVRNHQLDLSFFSYMSKMSAGEEKKKRLCPTTKSRTAMPEEPLLTAGKVKSIS